jgi:hypothetical protein
MIETDPAKVCFIIVKAREVHAKVEVENPVEPENPETASDAPDAANETETNYLIGTPLIADYLQEGLNQQGYPCTEYELDQL